MKKLFTLVALCACLGANADDTVTNYTDWQNLGSSWGDVTVTTNDDGTVTIEDPSGWGGASVSYWGNTQDWSAYDELTVTWDVETATITGLSLCIQYTASCVGDTETGDYAGNIGDGEISIKIGLVNGTVDKETYGPEVYQWWLQPQSAGSVTINGAYFTTYETTGISSIDNDNIVSVEYYSLSGQKLATPSTGVVIKKSTDASGNTSVKKVFVKTL